VRGKDAEERTNAGYKKRKNRTLKIRINKISMI
jgi:hypothetical protein